MTKDQLKEQLDELEVDYTDEMLKPELQELYDEAVYDEDEEVEADEPEMEETEVDEEVEADEPESKEEVEADEPESKEEVKDVKEPKWGDKYVDRKAATKAILDKAPKTNFMVPLGDDEKSGIAEETVTINGYRYTIKKGRMVEIPVPVMEQLANKYRVESTVAQKSIDGDTKKEDALSGR